MRNLLLAVLLSIAFLPSTPYALTVNRINGGANIIYIDFSIPGAAVPLELVRAYNSITATSEQTGWSGAFGWGWTSPFESTLITTPEHNVLLRDGGTGNTVIFKNQKEDPKARDSFYQEYKRIYFETKKQKKLTDSELAKLNLPNDLTIKLKNSSEFRLSEASRLGIKASVPKGDQLVSSEYGYQTIQFRNNEWVREKEGVSQYFDKDGRLTRQVDKNGFSFEFKYNTANKTQVSEITDQDKGVSLKFTWRNDRVIEVVDNRAVKARYTYDNSGNLTQVIDSNNQIFLYKYENKKFPHLLSRIDYVSESTAKEKIYREIKYDDVGLVISHRDKEGAEITYNYGRSSSDPENNFWTKVTKKFRGTKDELYDEYLLKAKADGTKYLYKQETKQNGASTTTLFTACCGKPAQIIKGKQVTQFKYSDDGLLTEKVGPGEDVKLEYHPRWKKITKVIQNGVTSKYDYDNRGNLVKASNSKNQKVALRYDKIGRIAEMTDPEGKQINFQYGNHGKPTIITEKGIGTIRIEYDVDGRILRTETIVKADKGRRPSEAKSQEVIQRVMKGFQHLLDIIRPAGVSLTG